MSLALSPASSDRFRGFALAALLAAFAFKCAMLTWELRVQPAGVDFMGLWAGGRALVDQARLYDFEYVTGLQGWPLGPEKLRPFAYAPATLLWLAPLAALPFAVAYGLWTAASVAVFGWACRRIGTPLWVLLFPAVWLAVLVGQVTLVIAGLVAAALTLRHRPLLAGLLLGLAATIKPQMLVFLPLALVAERQWRTLVAAGVTGLLVCLASAAIWGLQPWLDWLAALPRFQQLALSDLGLLNHAITPRALLTRLDLPGVWAYALAPPAAWLVWTTFRRATSVADRLIAVFAAPLLIVPYAMNYEAALLAPAMAIYLARTDAARWPLYAAAACLFAAGLVLSVLPLAMALLLLLASRLDHRPPLGGPAQPAASASALRGSFHSGRGKWHV